MVACIWHNFNHLPEGLDVEKDHILEMACTITDEHLTIVEEVNNACVLCCCIAFTLGFLHVGPQCHHPPSSRGPGWYE